MPGLALNTRKNNYYKLAMKGLVSYRASLNSVLDYLSKNSWEISILHIILRSLLVILISLSLSTVSYGKATYKKIVNIAIASDGSITTTIRSAKLINKNGNSFNNSN